MFHKFLYVYTKKSNFRDGARERPTLPKVFHRSPIKRGEMKKIQTLWRDEKVQEKQLKISFLQIFTTCLYKLINLLLNPLFIASLITSFSKISDKCSIFSWSFRRQKRLEMTNSSPLPREGIVHGCRVRIDGQFPPSTDADAIGYKTIDIGQLIDRW